MNVFAPRCLLILLVLAARPAFAGTLEDARSALDTGDYERALDLLDNAGSADRAAALLRAETLELTGRADEAHELLRAEATRSRPTPEARAAYGRWLVERGEWERAVEVLDPVAEGDEVFPPARYWRAIAFDALGRRSRARLELEDFVREYNRGRARNAEDLLYVALACHRLGLYSDSNATFPDALDLAPESSAVRLAWAELFLEKYRPDEARTLLDEVLARNPRHPRALALRAHAELSLTYDLAEARRLAEAALDVRADEPYAAEVLAAIDLDAHRYDEARRRLNTVLDQWPRRLDALALLGATEYLADDAAAFAEVERRVTEVQPRPAEFYHVVGEFASRNFRYSEALALFERAVAADAGFAPAYVSLGIAYSRAGDDGRALQFLRRAFDADPFNQQAFHMVELWESTLTQYRYVDDEQLDGLRYRFHRDEASVLSRYIPDVVRSTWREYARRYGFEPAMPVSIEVFADQPTFSIRSLGLPYASQHGICFGHVVTSRSPREGDFNWRMVLEHELSHVFSLQRSRSRVPRWFTEGLAEYDTMLSREEWRREEDLAIVRALQRDELIEVGGLDAAFIGVERPEQVHEAYFQASLVVEYIGTRWGYDALVGMLDAWAASKPTPAVFSEVLGIDVDAFDVEFEAELRRRYGAMLGLVEPALWWFEDREAFEAALERDPDVADAHARAAWARVADGDAGAAYDALERALELDPRNVHARLLAGHLAYRESRWADAREHYLAAVEAGARSYTALATLGELAWQDGRGTEALGYLGRAAELFPLDPALFARTAEIHEAAGNREAALAAWTRVARLDEHDAEVALRLAATFDEAGDRARAIHFAERAANVDPFNPDLHGLYGRLAYEARDWGVARRELELLRDSGTGDRAAATRMLVDVYRSLGLDDQADAARRELHE